MISGRSDSLHVHTVSPPTATGRPDGLRNQGVANDAAGSPVAGGLDLTAADLGADAADLAHEINPIGSTAGRDRLADAITKDYQKTYADYFQDGYDLGVKHALDAITGSMGRLIRMNCKDADLRSIGDADARLVAAAPDLLAVCKAVEDWESSTVYGHADVRAEYGIPENMNVYDWVRAARRAAIAKATGAEGGGA